MKSPIRRLIIGYFANHWRSVLVAAVLILIAELSALVEPIILRRVVDFVIPERNFQLLLLLSGGAICTRVLAAVVQRLQQRLSTKIGASIFRTFIVDFYDHIQRLDLSFFADTKMGEFMHRLGQDTYHVYRMVLNGLVVVATNLTVVLALLAYGFYLSPTLSLVLFVMVPIYVGTQRYAGKKTREATEAMVHDWSEVASFQSEKLGGVRLIKEMQAETVMRSTYDNLNSVAGASFRRLELATSLGQLLSNLTVYIGPTIVIALGGYLTIRGSMSLGSLLAFFYFSGRLFAPVGAIVQQQLAMQRARVGVKRIYDYFDRESSINELESPKPLPSGALSVEFENVGFTYDRDTVFSDLSFRVEPGETVGIVGVSGVGKSTVANLIFRFWDVQSGTVRVGDVDVRDVSLCSLRSRLGIVSQDTILFHDSIAANLRLAKSDATVEEIRDACDVAGIHEFIQSLPDTYDTVVGERGVKLSGGQRQRISIARAVLRNPDILLLDEATSHLDSETENVVQNALNGIASSRTSIIIAHRLSTLSACDRLLVIENGVIKESGTHAELLGYEGVYHGLWIRQANSDNHIDT